MNIPKIDRIIRLLWNEHVENINEDVYIRLLKGEGVPPYSEYEKSVNTDYGESLEIIVQAVTITKMLIELRNYFKIKPSSKSRYEELESSLNYRIDSQSMNDSVRKKIPDIINTILNDENH